MKQKKEKPRVVNGRYDVKVKQQAMDMWAIEGKSLHKIADEINVHVNTVNRWKLNDDPLNWEEYRKLAADQQSLAALEQVKKRAAEVMANQLNDSQRLRNVATDLLGRLEKDLEKGERDLTETTVDILRKIERVLSGVQQQQSTVFALPTHIVEFNSGGRRGQTLAGLDSMSDAELIKSIFETDGEGGKRGRR